MASFTDSLKNFLNHLKCTSDCCDKNVIIIENAAGITVDLQNTPAVHCANTGEKRASGTKIMLPTSCGIQK